MEGASNARRHHTLIAKQNSSTQLLPVLAVPLARVQITDDPRAHTLRPATAGSSSGSEERHRRECNSESQDTRCACER